jgi:hypothetical protein
LQCLAVHGSHLLTAIDLSQKVSRLRRVKFRIAPTLRSRCPCYVYKLILYRNPLSPITVRDSSEGAARGYRRNIDCSKLITIILQSIVSVISSSTHHVEVRLTTPVPWFYLSAPPSGSKRRSVAFRYGQRFVSSFAIPTLLVVVFVSSEE